MTAWPEWKAEDERTAIIAWLRDMAIWHDKNDDGWSDFDRWAQAYREAAEAIAHGEHLPTPPAQTGDAG